MLKGCWGASTTGWPVGLRVSSLGGYLMTDGSTPPPGGGGEGGRVGGGGERNNSDTVHGRAIYCDADNSGAVLESRSAAGS